jgi:hypothetical protein
MIDATIDGRACRKHLHRHSRALLPVPIRGVELGK